MARSTSARKPRFALPHQIAARHLVAVVSTVVLALFLAVTADVAEASADALVGICHRTDSATHPSSS
jgi:hypothetical protein